MTQADFIWFLLSAEDKRQHKIIGNGKGGDEKGPGLTQTFGGRRMNSGSISGEERVIGRDHDLHSSYNQ